MDDDELLNYIGSHARSEHAQTHRDHVARLLELAGHTAEGARCRLGREWYYLAPSSVSGLIATARERVRPTPDLSPRQMRVLHDMVVRDVNWVVVGSTRHDDALELVALEFLAKKGVGYGGSMRGRPKTSAEKPRHAFFEVRPKAFALRDGLEVWGALERETNEL